MILENPALQWDRVHSHVDICRHKAAVLNGRDVAAAHRHTQNALSLIIRGRGSIYQPWTERSRAIMRPADLVIQRPSTGTQ